jgi:hypothetical protein
LGNKQLRQRYPGWGVKHRIPAVRYQSPGGVLDGRNLVTTC